MQYFEIDDTRSFMSALFSQDRFRDFELSSAQVTTFMTFQIDGLMHMDYFTEDTLPDLLVQAAGQAADASAGAETARQTARETAQGTARETGRKTGAETNQTGMNGQAGKRAKLAPWPLAAPILSSLIKGKTPPLSLKLVLRLSDAHVLKLTSGEALPFSFSDIKGLFLNVNYENGKVSCTTGTSLNVFTLDKTLDNLWDQSVEKFLNLIA